MTGKGNKNIFKNDLCRHIFLKCMICVAKTSKKTINASTLNNIMDYFGITMMEEFSMLEIIQTIYEFKPFIDDTTISKIKDFMDLYAECKLLDKENLELNLLENLLMSEKNFITIALLRDLLTRTNFPFEQSLYLLFPTIVQSNLNGEELFQEISKLPSEHNNIKLIDLLESEYDEIIADAFLIKNLDDITKENKEIAFLVYQPVIDMIMKLVLEANNMVLDSIDNFEHFQPKIVSDSELFEVMNYKPSTKQLNVMRFIIGIEVDKKSIEEISKIYSESTYRIKEIQTNYISKLIERQSLYTYGLDLYLAKFFSDKSYISLEKLVSSSKKRGFTTGVIVALENNLSHHFNYIKGLEIISINEDLVDEVNALLANLDFIITKEQLSKLSAFELKIVKPYIKSISDTIFIKKEYDESSIYDYVIEKLFSRGLAINDINVSKFNDYIIEKLGWTEGQLNKEQLHSFITAENVYALIDEDTYQRRDKLNKISTSLKEDILQFVINQTGSVQYEAVFAKFENELKEDGIYNKYYLKTILDELLPDEIIVDDECLILPIKEITPDEVSEFISNYKGVLMMDTLRDTFPNIGDHVFYQKINESEFIPAGHGEGFIRFDQSTLSSQFKQVTNESILKIFKTTKSEVFGITKLYSYLKINHKDLMADYPWIDNSHFLFRIIETLFSHKYYFKKPYVARKKMDLSIDAILFDMLKKRCEFNVNTIKNLAYETGIDFPTIGFLNIFNKLSDEFVQIKKDAAVKKEELEIGDDTLKRIKNELEFYIRSYRRIDTATYNGYLYFPKVKYEWNKYLLVGIIRSYLSHVFSIEYTHSQYTSTEFIIRRIENNG